MKNKIGPTRPMGGPVTGLFGLVLCVLSVGCASGLRVRQFGGTPIDTAERSFVLLNDSDWEDDFRMALSQQKFILKKFASTEQVRQNRVTDSSGAKVENERSYTKAAARYGLVLSQKSRLDHCPWNDNIKANFSLEVTDLETNEVVMVITKGNWTGLCGPFSVRRKYVFEELADELRKKWGP